MRLSVLIVNWNTADDLGRCLLGVGCWVLGSGSTTESSTQHPTPNTDDLQVIVVDNASVDGSVEMVRGRYPGVTVLALDRNLGYAEGNNLAAEAAQGEWLLFLNPDTVAPDGASEALIRFLEEHPKAALVAPRLVSPDGETQASVRGMPTPVALLAAWFRLNRLGSKSAALTSYRLPGFDYGLTQQAPQPMASAWMVRREAWEDVGPFDPAFPLFFNDVDWCLRAQRRGWEIWYSADVSIEHRGGASTSQVKARATWESHRAMAAFYRKHYASQLGPARLALCTAVIRTVGAARYLWYRARQRQGRQ